VLVRGLADLPLWVLLASQLSRTPLSLSASPDLAKAAAEEWTSTLTACGVGAPVKAASVMVARFKGWDVATEVREVRAACAPACLPACLPTCLPVAVQRAFKLIHSHPPTQT
jgi:hypothetical protein